MIFKLSLYTYYNTLYFHIRDGSLMLTFRWDNEDRNTIPLLTSDTDINTVRWYEYYGYAFCAKKCNNGFVLTTHNYSLNEYKTVYDNVALNIDPNYSLITCSESELKYKQDLIRDRYPLFTKIREYEPIHPVNTNSWYKPCQI